MVALSLSHRRARHLTVEQSNLVADVTKRAVLASRCSRREEVDLGT